MPLHSNLDSIIVDVTELSLHVAIASTGRNGVVGDVLLLLSELLTCLVPGGLLEDEPDIASPQNQITEANNLCKKKKLNCI